MGDYGGRGFNKIKPGFDIGNNRGYINQTFTNNVGAKIRINDAKVMIYGKTCQAAIPQRDVPERENFLVESDLRGCIDMRVWEPEYPRLNISYSTSIGGIKTNHSESGEIRITLPFIMLSWVRDYILVVAFFLGSEIFIRLKPASKNASSCAKALALICFLLSLVLFLCFMGETAKGDAYVCELTPESIGVVCAIVYFFARFTRKEGGN
jgi:hypothetical protein